jgi:hypothetical protein
MVTQIQNITEKLRSNKRIRQIAWTIVYVVAVFLLGVGSSFLKQGLNKADNSKQAEILYEQINPKDGYKLPVSYGGLGPRLLESGVIDYDAFVAIYEKGNSPLSADQVDILQSGSDEQIVLTKENAHFILNFFWAVGLANNNPILTDGPMVHGLILQDSNGKIEDFASTGGWTLGTKPVTELYASLDLIPLTAEQQKMVEEVAAAVYRPCCNNSTLFPDCNHGMAMLGLLELMASQGTTTDQMFEAAKYVNAFWFPQPALEIATYLQTNYWVDFVHADPRQVVERELASASGFKMVHQSLVGSDEVKQAPSQGGGCSN